MADDLAWRHGREAGETPSMMEAPQGRNHGEVTWGSGDTGANVPVRGTKSCLFEGTKAQMGVHQFQGGTGFVQGMPLAHRSMPMTVATLRTVAGPSSTMLGALAMPKKCLLD